MRTVSIVINARLESSRLPNKLIKPLWGSNLIDVALAKLARIQNTNKYLAAYDPEIIDIYEPYSNNISLIKRDLTSVSRGMVPHTIAFRHFEKVPDDYIMIMNPCHPFVDVSVYEEALRQFTKGSSKTMTSVVLKNNVFFDHKHVVINSTSGVEVQTHKQPPVYEMAHVFHIIDKNRFLSEGKILGYKPNDPELFIVDKMSAFDVDDEDDFNICQSMRK